MANFYGSGRTNYVKVKDKDKFKELCEKYDFTFIEQDGKVGFYTNNEDGDSTFWEEDENEDMQPTDTLPEFAELMKDNEVLVFQRIGNEKMRYLVGEAIAYNNKGKSVVVSINDIYAKAKKLGKNISIAEY